LSEEELSGLGGVVRGKIEEFVGELGRKCHAAVTQRAQDKVAYGEFFSSGYLSTFESFLANFESFLANYEKVVES